MWKIWFYLSDARFYILNFSIVIHIFATICECWFHFIFSLLFSLWLLQMFRISTSVHCAQLDKCWDSHKYCFWCIESNAFKFVHYSNITRSTNNAHFFHFLLFLFSHYSFRCSVMKFDVHLIDIFSIIWYAYGSIGSLCAELFCICEWCCSICIIEGIGQNENHNHEYWYK